MINLSNLQPAPGSTHARKRLGRGTSSGQGKTAGKGQKGQNSRAGGGVRVGFEAWTFACLSQKNNAIWLLFKYND